VGVGSVGDVEGPKRSLAYRINTSKRSFIPERDFTLVPNLKYFKNLR
jgi:hypothetical protein